jgi:predicted pyridoxine 5'-phosphate oxidase superfamily flavin-nucleotide-binding protein
MAARFLAEVLTPQALEAQRRAYGRSSSPPPRGERDALGPAEAELIATRDSFYMATVTGTGWPYLQHRGGPPGFLRALDAHTLAFADLRGNRQLVSTGNLAGDDRVALFLMDYPGPQDPGPRPGARCRSRPGARRGAGAAAGAAAPPGAALPRRGGGRGLELPGLHHPPLHRGGGRGSGGPAPAPDRRAGGALPGWRRADRPEGVRRRRDQASAHHPPAPEAPRGPGPRGRRGFRRPLEIPRTPWVAPGPRGQAMSGAARAG